MTVRGLNFPQKYLQGPNVLKKLYTLASGLGKNGAFAIVGGYFFDHLRDLVTSSFDKKPFPIVLERFQKECSMVEINRCKLLLLEKKFDVVIGIGGGKVMDTGFLSLLFLFLLVIQQRQSVSLQIFRS
jgi:glycerol dehydrogenase